MKQEKQSRRPRKIVDGTLTFGEKTAARRLGVSYMTLFRRRKRGEVSFFRIGSRVLYSDACLVEYLARNRRAVA